MNATLAMNATFLSQLNHCDRLSTGVLRHSCASDAIAALPDWPSSQDVLSYFYDAAPPGMRIRHPSCTQHRNRGGSTWYKWDKVFSSKSSADTCLWGNMPFSKSILIILLARALDAEFIVESGRMGGISLTHYAHFGFRLTSIELLPIPHVKAALQRTLPSLDMRDGDASVLMPKVLAEILRQKPSARIAAIIDGPKEGKALDLARKVINDTVLVAIDDLSLPSSYEEQWPFSTARSNDAQWRARLPMSADRAALQKPGPDESANVTTRYQLDAILHFSDKDVSSVLLGAQRPRGRRAHGVGGASGGVGGRWQF